MPHQVIIGGGPAATNAIETIRQFDQQSAITLISDEPAHSRMAIPYWLSGQIPREQTLTGDQASFEKLNVSTRFGERVTGIDTQSKQSRCPEMPSATIGCCWQPALVLWNFPLKDPRWTE